MDSPMEKVELGLFVVRGDNVAIIAECEEGDKGDDNGGMEEEDVRAEPIKEIAGNR